MEEKMENAVNQSTELPSKNHLLFRGILYGALVGGALSLMDSQTRNKVKNQTLQLKGTGTNVFSHVKDNPAEVVERAKRAASTLQEAITEAKKIYDMVNEQVFETASEVKTRSAAVLDDVKDATDEVKGISMKVVEARKTVSDDSQKTKF